VGHFKWDTSSGTLHAKAWRSIWAPASTGCGISWAGVYALSSGATASVEV
jgi:hypothetical protein